MKTPLTRSEQLSGHMKAGRWNEAVAVLDELAENESDPAKRFKYRYTVGVIERDKIGDHQAAVRAFDAALDANVLEMKAFEAIEQILTEQQDWNELERAYRRMLRRVLENDDLVSDDIKALLWQNLGDVYRRRLDHVQSAIQAYEAALQYKPDDPVLLAILSELEKMKR